jgi:hypothetical protein
MAMTARGGASGAGGVAQPASRARAKALAEKIDFENDMIFFDVVKKTGGPIGRPFVCLLTEG